MTNELIVMTSSRYGITDLDTYKILRLLLKDVLYGRTYVDGRGFYVLANYLGSFYSDSETYDYFDTSVKSFMELMVLLFINYLGDFEKASVVTKDDGVYVAYNGICYVPECFTSNCESIILNNEYVLIHEDGTKLIMLLKYNLYYVSRSDGTFSEFKRYAKIAMCPDYVSYLQAMTVCNAGDDIYKLYFKGIKISDLLDLNEYATSDFTIEDYDFVSKKYLQRRGINSLCIKKYSSSNGSVFTDTEMWCRRSLWYTNKIFDNSFYLPLMHECPIQGLPEMCYNMKFKEYTKIGDVLIGLSDNGCFVYYEEERMFVAIKGL